MSAPPARGSLRERAAAVDWYHSIELEPGLVTPGWFDTRAAARAIPMPESLAGRRCLDVGTYDGFWAFEMERRGADEVVAVDVLDPARWDWPRGSSPEVIAEMTARKRGNPGFALAHEALGSRVRFEDRSIYELDPGELGEFDLVFVGSLLIHLRDPVGALERVRSVCRGELLLSDAVDPWLTAKLPRRPVAQLDGIGRPWWWKPNLAALRAIVETAGFELVRDPVRFRMRPGGGYPRPRVTPRTFTSRGAREPLAVALRGDPHAAILARPNV
jgi:tRNA (mo5U34)-methyltransferase